MCGLADIKPDKYGQVQNYVTESKKFGTFKSSNDFFNVAIDARLPHNISLGGGADTGRSVQDRCFVVDSPQELLNCRVVTPFSAQTQVKLHGVFPFKAGVVASFAWQGYVRGPGTIVEGIHLLPAASTVTISRPGEIPTP